MSRFWTQNNRTIDCNKERRNQKKKNTKNNEYFAFIIYWLYEKHFTWIILFLDLLLEGHKLNKNEEKWQSKVLVQQWTQIKNSSVICARFVRALSMQIIFFACLCASQLKNE